MYLAIDNTLDKVEPFGNQLFAVVHDEDATDVELDVVALLALLKHVKGSAARHEQDGAELQLAFDRKVLDGQVVFPVVRQRLVEAGVFLVGDVIGVTRPDGLDLVELFGFLRVLDSIFKDGTHRGELLDLLGLLFLDLFLVLDLLNLGGFLVSLGLVGLDLFGFVVRDFLFNLLLDNQLDRVADEFRVLLDDFLNAALFQVLQLIFLHEELDHGSAAQLFAFRVMGNGEGAAFKDETS